MQLAVLTDGRIATNIKEIPPGDTIMSPSLSTPQRSETGGCWIWTAAPYTPLREDKIAELHVLPLDAPRRGTSSGHNFELKGACTR